MTILPKIPSKLLRIAHADLEKSRDDPNCTIDMNIWLDFSYQPRLIPVPIAEPVSPAQSC